MEEELKRLFIHIPKNGGTSVHKENDDMVMDILSFDHERWRDVPRDIRYIYKSFAVTRNPWARTISRYEMGIPTHFVSPPVPHVFLPLARDPVHVLVPRPGTHFLKPRSIKDGATNVSDAVLVQKRMTHK